ncbi:MAG: glycine--tRNA ligase [Patescibacteria group bacterium]
MNNGSGKKLVSMDEIVNVAKRRGFIYPSSEIYGGLANAWDYGPYGVLLKNNVKQVWWQDLVMKRTDIVGLDSAILMNPKVWEASGHIAEFTDPLVDCKECKQRFRADHLQDKKCPNCGGELTEARNFNLMFKTHAGPVDDESNVVYLRPETAQGIFVDFKTILDTTRNKLPFGVAQIGKSFRNEITPGNFTFRTREFEQFEIEYFVKSALEAKKAFDEWVKARFDWYKNLGIKSDNLRLREHEKTELAHYAIEATDVEYNFPFGFSELEGVANRGNYDLSQHEKFSGQELKYFDEETKTKILPHVIEPSGGVDRAVLAFLVDAYTKERVSGLADEQVSGEERIILKFHPRLAPIKAAVFPLIKKEPLIIKAKEILHQLKEKWFVEYDESGTVGRRYRRQDEIGTPYCITVDFDSLEDNMVTVRDRDTMKQERVPIAGIMEWLEAKLG